MKQQRHTLLAIALVALLAGCEGDTGLKDTPDVKFFGVASARIEYDVTVSGRVLGSLTKTIANYGMYTSDHLVITGNAEGKAERREQLTIQDDTVMYVIDMVAKEGTSSTSELRALLAMARQLPNPGNLPVSELTMARNGAEKVGNETVAGKECAVYEIPGGVRAAFWNGLMLKYETSMGAMTHVVKARTVATDVSLSHEDFEPPDGVTITAQKPGLPAGHPPVQ